MISKEVEKKILFLIDKDYSGILPYNKNDIVLMYDENHDKLFGEYVSNLAKTLAAGGKKVTRIYSGDALRYKGDSLPEGVVVTTVGDIMTPFAVDRTREVPPSTRFLEVWEAVSYMLSLESQLSDDRRLYKHEQFSFTNVGPLHGIKMDVIRHNKDFLKRRPQMIIAGTKDDFSKLFEHYKNVGSYLNGHFAARVFDFSKS